jgi:hypothetical protein
MKFEFGIGDYEVLATGSIIGVANKPIIFKIEDLVFELLFKDNSEHKEQKLTPEIPSDGKKMILTFENFNNGLGIGNLEPLEVGSVGEKKLFLNYRVYSLADNTGKLLHYTWLLNNKGGAHVK